MLARLRNLRKRLAADFAEDLRAVVRDEIRAELSPHLGSSPEPNRVDDTGFAIRLDYPPTSELRRRWSQESGANARLSEILSFNLTEGGLFASAGALNTVSKGVAIDLPPDDPRPRWKNPMLAGLDAVAIGAALSSKPRLYLEIGSGNSTKFARHFITALQAPTRLVSIDPHPRAECDDLCDQVIRTPLELLSLDDLPALERGDILFFDGSHRCFMNSDVTVFFLDILPRLPPGVKVGIHDIFLPFDYPHDWFDRYYSEQFILGAYLLGLGDRAKILLPGHLACLRYHELPWFQRLQSDIDCPPELFHGCSLWFEHTGP